ncbi:MAG: DUF4307 domain-containing protein [Propionibacteriaceae bacterium]|nr:DUF4307 domain-containing protein [Propionibacteriaceae bacterium]
MTEEAAERLARRYPPARPNRWWIPVALALAAAGAAWLVWAGTYGATGITARVDAFDVRSDTVIAVTVTVDRPDPRSGADCLLFAQAVTYDRVGETHIRVEPGGAPLTTVELELRTFKRATTAAVESCRATP